MTHQAKNALPEGFILQGPAHTYRVERVLGQGSFGITYLATTKVTINGALGSLETTINVALKEFFMAEVNGRDNYTVTSGNQDGLFDNYKRKFAKEAQNLSNLEHPHIVKVLESFEANNTIYYSMEFCENGNLDDLIGQNNGIQESVALPLFKQIAEALIFMHFRQLLHLDLKPSNIMFRNPQEVILIDFGLSKHYDPNGNPESSTTIGGGTPGYSPIEQANYKSGDKLETTLDVYALGATLYKMLTGNRPPVATDIFNDGFPAEWLRSKQISERLIACIEKAMSPAKRERYQSVGEFLSAVVATTPQTEATEQTELTSPNPDKTKTYEPKSNKPKSSPDQTGKAQPNKKQYSLKYQLNDDEIKQQKYHIDKILFLCLTIIIGVLTIWIVIELNSTSDIVTPQNIPANTTALNTSAPKTTDSKKKQSTTGKKENKQAAQKPTEQLSASTLYTKGEEAYNSKNYKSAEEYWHQAADMGFKNAQYKLGYMYYAGIGVSSDTAIAIKWFSQAAKQGHIEAQYELGYIYYLGDGVSRNYALAKKWVSQPAELGIAAAQYLMGTIYEYGLGVAKDHSEAKKWYYKAAAQNHTEAKKALNKLTSTNVNTEVTENVEMVQQVTIEEEIEDDQPFVKVEKMPSFQGGDILTFRTWVQKSIIYPQTALINNISGRVLLMFVIERDGSLTDIQVLQSPDSSLSNEAIRVLKISPKWEPGKQRNKPVRVKYTLPVDFRIAN